LATHREFHDRAGRFHICVGNLENIDVFLFVLQKEPSIPPAKNHRKCKLPKQLGPTHLELIVYLFHRQLNIGPLMVEPAIARHGTVTLPKQGTGRPGWRAMSWSTVPFIILRHVGVLHGGVKATPVSLDFL
jgi:hypothetical protein